MTSAVHKARINNNDQPCLKIRRVDQHNSASLFISANPTPDMTFAKLCQNLADYLKQEEATIVSLEVFGRPGAEQAQLADYLSNVTYPVTWLEGIGDVPSPLWGMQVWALTGIQITPVCLKGHVIGSIFETDSYRCCRLGGAVPGDATQSRQAQTRDVFEQLQSGLRSAGMTFGDVLRTWFYNRDMLEWYDEFNEVRTAFFEAHDVFSGRVPASTGIGAHGADAAALTAGLIAFTPKANSPYKARVIPSPLQCPALDYGSSFSRAMELEDGNVRWLFISGTASIAPRGESMHLDDVEKQIALTMDVVAAMLKLRAMDWRHVTRAIAYFKSSDDASALNRYLDANGIARFPLIFANTDICRDDLLFEIELDTITTC